MKVNNYIQWKRLLIEAAAIVSSILLAFAIDAWWEERQESHDEQKLLIALKTELENNIVKIEGELRYRRAVDESIMRILAAGAEEIELASDELDKLISDLVWWGSAEFQTGALVSTVQGGFLSLIENKELRHGLAGLPAEYAHMVKLENQDKETLTSFLNPYLFENVSLPQISNSLAMRPGVEDNPSPSSYPVGATRDHSPVLRDSVFLNIVTQSRYDHIDAIWRYEILKAKISEVVGLIDEQLK